MEKRLGAIDSWVTKVFIIYIELQKYYKEEIKMIKVGILGTGFGEQIESRQDYITLKKCVNISILDFNYLTDSDEYYS